ncbi:TetR/AcrR family transcriptional regulator [Amycolatopsis balhimycina DSM 5908]|uniref:TetR/AcrR family transcriptional regulator n=1 Tax=Amycolatopsis balhimycina DSM 5908 TaxID=1081091 RepID=A0A428W395_AMYBA|nr:TetR/AcrR family transcriptional regulator [Amycolatopsis balhimycina]RSM37544.1 TetR/AcrR family transcriptional regulator [Amycolatopsis balhimycina DSM 5908]
MNKKIDRGQATREHLVAVATGLFTEHGYDGTSIEAVLRTAEVSRGALYHHFPGKDALFTAVLDAVYEQVEADGARAVEGITEPVAALRAACRAWIRITADPVVRQVLLIDAPAVLGWQRWRELDERRTLGKIKAALRFDGRIPAARVDLFAHVLLAGMNEIAMLVARAEDHTSAAAEGEAAAGDLLDRLLGA